VKKKEKVINKERIKEIRGLVKTASMIGTTRLLQRHPRTIPSPGLHYDWTSLKPYHFILHGLHNLLRKLSSSYGCWPNRLFCLFLQLCIVGQCNVFELLDDMLGVFCIYLINLMMRYDLHHYDPKD
jgi:hypothetical protein